MLNDFEQRKHLAACIKFLFLLIHAYFSLQLALNFFSLLLISINYILKVMESRVKKLKRTVKTNTEILQSKLTDTNKLYTVFKFQVIKKVPFRKAGGTPGKFEQVLL